MEIAKYDLLLNICILFYLYLELTSFFRELDQRVIDLNKESKRRIPERKERKVGTTLSSVPPSDAPKWTINNKDWLKGKILL